eukprot:jgi/Undpi1/353/HiC_scaffold_1.g00349.m1
MAAFDGGAMGEGLELGVGEGMRWSGHQRGKQLSRDSPRSAPLNHRRRFRGEGRGDSVRVAAVSASAASAEFDGKKSAPSEGTGAGAAAAPEGDSGSFTPGSRPPEGASKQDAAAVEYAERGDWKKALQLIKAMRNSDFRPSVSAYVATIEACRRSHQFDFASTLLTDMNRVCMPEDLFKEYAATHPNDPGVTQTQRVFALLLMMREDGVSPLEETYRAIMGLCSKERLWQLSLLLLEHLKQSGLEPGKFVWDEICSVLFKTGHAEMATMMFETALEDNFSEAEGFDSESGMLDLHSHTVSTALAAVRVVLLDMMRRPSTRDYHDANRSLHIVTGMGNNSKDREAVIKPQVIDLLEAMGLEPKMVKNNDGCVVLKTEALKAFIDR